MIVIGRNGEEKQTNKQRNNRGSKTAIEGSASRRSTQKKNNTHAQQLYIGFEKKNATSGCAKYFVSVEQIDLRPS